MLRPSIFDVSRIFEGKRQDELKTLLVHGMNVNDVNAIDDAVVFIEVDILKWAAVVVFGVANSVAAL